MKQRYGELKGSVSANTCLAKTDAYNVFTWSNKYSHMII